MATSIGIDIGSLTTKAVVLQDDKIVAACEIRSSDEAEQSARTILAEAGRQCGLMLEGQPLVATGMGSKSVSFAKSKAITTCLARGIRRTHPSVHINIDIGAESCTIIKLNERGKMIDWAGHDKCASGTGVFLQQMAKLMQVSLEEMSSFSARATDRADISSTCAVF
ncbi:MAG TPA: BadF/BadG/BcrA/BcrD ATPase family protein, partial [Dehalococcoidales bacterium]|nr:BadF/BadG/BcrA/BcrD ATPase family protein [Dehalococcoidales bacterium]